MRVSEIINYLESIIPKETQENYDNCGLLVGNPDTELKGILCTLDCTEDIILEAETKKCNLVISHHPILFKGIKKITGSNYVERTILKAIKSDIAIYAIHTNLDNFFGGVNDTLARRLNLKNFEILLPKKDLLSKLALNVPNEFKEKVLNALFSAGAGNIGKYSECGFFMEGEGCFLPGDESNPFKGKQGLREHVNEAKVEVIFPNYSLNNILSAMQLAHPYEEIAYDIIPLTNQHKYIGSGLLGTLPEPIAIKDFLQFIKNTLNVPVIKHTKLIHKLVQRVAICGGSGSFLIPAAIGKGADIFISSDFKYHEFFDADNKIVIADVGHYESEQFTPELLVDILKKKITNFALHLSEVNTNPITYF